MKDLLLRNNNTGVIRRLSSRYLKANRGRNLIAIAAIALTTLLFTTLFTIGGGMVKTQQDQMMRQVGGSSHGSFKYVTREECDKLKNHPSIKEYGESIFAASADNAALSKIHSEIRWGDENYARWAFTIPTTGTLPERGMELATSTIVLDMLGLPHKTGITVPLEYQIDGVSYKESFTLTGFWEGDSMSGAQMIYLSEDYINSVVTLDTLNYYQRENDTIGSILGLDVMFNSSFNIESKLNRIISDSGYEPNTIATGVNWAYLGSGTPDILSILIAVVSLLLIGSAGYLIIYNVFYISVTKDIKNYGLLKTIGTAPKQLKHLVRRQALLLSLAGIPLGIVTGFLLGTLLLPTVMKITSYAGEKVVIPFSLWIPVVSAVFALITVFISCQKPCKLAAGVSPMEALRAHEVSSGRRKARKSNRINTITMAWHNVVRSKKRVISVVISLSLSIVLLNSVYGATRCFDMDKFISNNIITDFSIANEKLMAWYELTYLEEQTVKDLSALTGVRQASTVYMQESSIPVDEKVQAAAREFAKSQSLPVEGDFIEYLKKLGGQQVHIYGMDAFAYEKLDFYGEKPDWETFSSGRYALTSSMTDFDKSLTVFKKGDVMTLEDRNGQSQEFTSLANADVPYATSARHGHLNEIDIILPLSQYLEYFNQDGLIFLHLEAEEGMIPSLEASISDYVSSHAAAYVSRTTYEAEFRQLEVTYLVVGGVLAGILCLVGLLNFLNSIATSIFTRRQEFAMLQSVGMTTGQLRAMLIWEGLWYILLTTACTLTVGNLLSFVLVKLLAGQMWFFSYHFTMTPMILGIAFFFLPAFLIPRISYRSVSRLSIVERLRTQ